MSGRLAGRIALVTGASSGIGAAIARAFAEEGATTVITARRRDRLDSLANELAHTRFHVVPADLQDEAQVLALFEATDAIGPIDLLVNCAGAAVSVQSQDMSLATWNEIIGLNLTATFLCSREALRRMIPRKRGRILNIGSISGLVPRENSLAYTASKFGLEGLTRSLALDARRHGITVSILRPGATLSELGGFQGDRSMIGPEIMDPSAVAAAAVTMASLPDEANLLEATILPIAQPFLGRG